MGENHICRDFSVMLMCAPLFKTFKMIFFLFYLFSKCEHLHKTCGCQKEAECRTKKAKKPADFSRLQGIKQFEMKKKSLICVMQCLLITLTISNQDKTAVVAVATVPTLLFGECGGETVYGFSKFEEKQRNGFKPALQTLPVGES